MTGLASYRVGLVAEEAVARHYQEAGLSVVATRWRGQGGEIDLIMREGAALVFIEVKQAASHAVAALRISERQMARIVASASEFLAGEPEGQNTESRFDVALVDQHGQIKIVPNAFAA